MDVCDEPARVKLRLSLFSACPTLGHMAFISPGLLYSINCRYLNVIVFMTPSTAVTPLPRMADRLTDRDIPGE